MNSIKMLSKLFVMVIFVFALLGFSACSTLPSNGDLQQDNPQTENGNLPQDNSQAGNENVQQDNPQTEYVNVYVKQFYGSTETECAEISGAGRYVKGSEVRLHVENVDDDYYFVRWLTNTKKEEYVFTATEDITIEVFFEKWKVQNFHGHRIKIVNSGKMETINYGSLNALKISPMNSDSQTFSYWAMNGKVFCPYESFNLFESQVTEDMEFVPYHTNCGVFAMACSFSDAQLSSFKTLFTNRGIANYSEVQSFINSNLDSTNYSFIIDNYQSYTSDLASLTNSNMTGNVSYTEVRYNKNLSSSKACYAVIGKVFYDVDGVLKLGAMSSSEVASGHQLHFSEDLTVRIANSFDGKITHRSTIGISITASS